VTVGALGVGPLIAGCLAQWVTQPLTVPYLVFVALGVVAQAGVHLPDQDLAGPGRSEAAFSRGGQASSVPRIQRALRYRITTLETIERIACLHLREGAAELPLAEDDEAFRQRPAYQEGALTDLPDLSIYQDPDHE